MGACCETHMSDPFADTLLNLKLRKIGYESINEHLEGFNEKFSMTEYSRRRQSAIFLQSLAETGNLSNRDRSSNTLIVELNYEKLLEYTNEIIESTILQQYRFFNEMYLQLDLNKEKILLAFFSLIRKPNDAYDSGKLFFHALSFGSINEKIFLQELLEKMKLYLNLNLFVFTNTLADLYKVPEDKTKEFNAQRLKTFEDTLFKVFRNHFARANQKRNTSQEVDFLISQEDFADFILLHPYLLNFESLRYVFLFDVSLEKYTSD